MSEREVVVHQVCVRKAAGYNLMSVNEFLALPPTERTNLILQRRIEFLDDKGEPLPTLDAVRSISQTRAAARPR